MIAAPLRRALLALAVWLAIGAAPSLHAQTHAQTPAPLARKVTLHFHGVSLRDALDQLSAAAHIRLSYSAELLPLDRSIDASFTAATVAAVLAELLKGVAVTPVVAGPDQVVLAPARPPPANQSAEEITSERPTSLDRVIVTGSTAGQTQRPLTVALDVVSGPTLQNGGVSDLSRALDGAVPGIWLWEQSPASLLARYGSIRGASSFGATYPKIYIDGIEVANPLLITQIDPASIDRVEVIRGPQGAALYGADAISGVVNIITRHANTVDGSAHAKLLTSAGVSSSSYASQSLFAQDHTLELATGTALRSAQLDLSAGSLGAYYTGATSDHFEANGGVRVIGPRSLITGTIRVFSEHVGAAVNPLLVQLGQPVSGQGSQASSNGASPPQSLTEYTVGGTLKFAQSDRWTHTLIAGVDGYRLANVADESTPFPSSADSALRAASGSANRTTLRASSVAHFGSAEHTAATLTFAAEQSSLFEQPTAVQLGAAGRTSNRGPGGGPPPVTTTTSSASDWQSDAGLVTQADFAIHDNYFLTAGARLERSDGYVDAARYDLLPMTGVAAVRTFGDVTVKLRAAYGSGIRAPVNAVRETVLGGISSQPQQQSLSSEQQSGTEAGIDLYIGNALSLQLTRFDQLASGLIQQVVIPDSSSYGSGGYATRLALQYQNVGAITNRGWEFQASARSGRLSIGGALSLVQSRVHRIANGYSGDLRVGDRVLEVPAATMSITAAWTAAKWSWTLTATRAADWIDYDRIALDQAYVNFDRRTVPLVGADLRGYWRAYDGVTRLRASLTRAIGHGFTFVLTGENLLGQQLGEPDNVTIVPGRTVTTGVRAAFF
jgi:iron complex outermembrane recepter protein